MTRRPLVPALLRAAGLLTASALVAAALPTAAVAVPTAPIGPTGPTATARAAYALVEGAGSTGVAVLLNQWIADADPLGIPVAYQATGSGQGRQDFGQDLTDFAVSETPFEGTESEGRPFAYVPLAAEATAFTYQLHVGGDLVRNLRLSGRTVAEIFTGTITRWSDPAITADNNGRRLPDKKIVPVVHAESSGVTSQLTAWMDTVHPGIWRRYAGAAGPTSLYPRTDAMLGRTGSDAVMNSVAGPAGEGSIGYLESLYPLERDYPTVRIGNAAGYFVEPTPATIAVALTRASFDRTADPATNLTQHLDAVYTHPDPRAYPLSSYVYGIIPIGADDPRMTTSKRQSLLDFSTYVICQGQTKAAPYGFSPLPLTLVQAGFDQLDLLAAADPGVHHEQVDPGACGNPTYDGEHPNRNVLAATAPAPAPCDARGAGPCGYVPPRAFAGVRISARPTVGETVRARLEGRGTFRARYQWRLDGRAIPGASQARLRVRPAFVGGNLTVRVTALGTTRTSPPRRVQPR